MIKLKSYISAASLAIFTLLVSTSASAETCSSVYSNGLYEEALPLCLQEEDNFKLGVIYGKQNNCLMMKKYYRLADAPKAKGNMGLHLLTGTRGCEKDVPSGITLLEEAVEGGRVGFGRWLGKHYSAVDNKKMAKVYYRKSVDYIGDYDWSVDRARESFGELIKLLNEKELKNFYLRKINVSTIATDWEQELASKAINALKSLLDTEEKLEFLLENTVSNATYKCEIGENLYNLDFQGLIVELKKKNKTSAYISRLCEGDKEYFIGKTFENGLGNKEDFQEAYRLYLIAGANGNEYAKAARDRIRDQLTPEQVQEAVCLADYGIEPSYFNKVRCKF
jgi:TPR repeat protein